MIFIAGPFRNLWVNFQAICRRKHQQKDLRGVRAASHAASLTGEAAERKQLSSGWIQDITCMDGKVFKALGQLQQSFFFLLPFVLVLFLLILTLDFGETLRRWSPHLVHIISYRDRSTTPICLIVNAWGPGQTVRKGCLVRATRAFLAVTFGCESPGALCQTIFPIPMWLKNRHKATVRVREEEGKKAWPETSLCLVCYHSNGTPMSLSEMSPSPDWCSTLPYAAAPRGPALCF